MLLKIIFLVFLFIFSIQSVYSAMTEDEIRNQLCQSAKKHDTAGFRELIKNEILAMRSNPAAPTIKEVMRESHIFNAALRCAKSKQHRRELDAIIVSEAPIRKVSSDGSNRKRNIGKQGAH